MQDQDKILNFLQVTGPTIPSKVAKNIRTDILLASAHLSDLASRGKVKISKLKIGGSPLYYLAGQEEQLYHFAENNLNPKDFQVLNNLKEQKIMREAELDLLSKVALRSLKDFAIPLNVNVEGRSELFWKWHLVSSEETNQIINNLISKQLQTQEKRFQNPPHEERNEITNSEPQPDDSLQKKVSEEQKTIQSTIIPEPKEEQITPAISETKTSLRSTTEPSKLINEMTTPNENLEEETKSVEIKPKETIYPKEENKESDKLKIESKKTDLEKKPFLQKVKEKIVRKRKAAEDNFIPEIEDFLTNLKIEIEQTETIRKNSEINFIIKVNSVIGEMKYFCKAKKKNRCDERDLSAAYMEAQVKKLPLLFLYSNELNNKAQEMLDSGTFDNILVKKIE